MNATGASSIEVVLPQAISPRQRRELTAFARYCILRLERDLGKRKAWLVETSPNCGGYVTRIVVRDLGTVIEMTGVGLDGPLSIWDAICQVEQSLRESQASPLRRILAE